MAFSSGGALSGAASGAAAGSFGGATGALIGAGVGALAGGFFGGKRKELPTINIDAQIDDLKRIFAELRAQATQEQIKLGQQQRRGAASNLAARGTLRSGVSENVFGQIRESTQQNVQRAVSGLTQQEAGIRSSLLSRLAGLSQQRELARVTQFNKERAAIFGQAGTLAAGFGRGFGKAGGFSSLFNRGGSQTAPTSSNLIPDRRLNLPGFRSGSQ